MAVAAYLRISQNRAKAILAVVEAPVSEWRNEARALGMIAEDLDTFEDAFEHKEREAAQRTIR